MDWIITADHTPPARRGHPSFGLGWDRGKMSLRWRGRLEKPDRKSQTGGAKPMAARVEFFFDLSSPWTRLAYLLVGDHSEAEDIVQAVFTAAAARWAMCRITRF